MPTQCSCPCGGSRFVYSGALLLRVCCHCRICQQIYKAPYADFVIVRSRQVYRPLVPSIQFAKYRAPPAVKRGLCRACRKPVLALLPLGRWLGLAFVPVANLPPGVALPAPALHSFYDRRVADVDDDAPKVSGYWASQWAVSWQAFAALFARRASPQRPAVVRQGRAQPVGRAMQARPGPHSRDGEQRQGERG